MSGDILRFPTDTAVSTDDYLPTEKVVGGRVMRQKSKPSDLIVTATGGQARTLAAWTEIVDAGTTDLALIEQGSNATAIGAKADPAAGTVTCTIERFGKFFTLDFTLTAARMTVTDAAGDGSFGALKIFDFVQGGVQFLSCRQNYTAFAEGAALTGAAGDAAFVLGVGTVAVAAAADGALSGTSVNIGTDTATITLSEGTGTGTKHNASTANADGTATAADIYLNMSGSAATIDATSTLDVTGTITIAGVMMGDD